MTLARDPEREYQAQRSAILRRFVAGAHVDVTSAERWVAEWERRAPTVGVRRESSSYWSTGLRWIATQRDQGEASSARRREAS